LPVALCAFQLEVSNSEAPFILAIETATRAGNVALTQGAKILSSAVGDASESHSVGLLATIESVLQRTGVNLTDVDFFAVAKGPGSFTGLRIGIATTKALAVCAGKKCKGISTLAAIAYAAGESAHTISTLRAGRGELFAQLFSYNADGVHALDEAIHITPPRLGERYAHLPSALWAGEGAELYGDAFMRDGWTLAPQCDELATSIAALAFAESRNGKLEEPSDLSADYVRASDAEINERWQREKTPPPVSV
jgi:tRNA threonylcarbamoyladenosine biosynthesis protein TsaB